MLKINKVNRSMLKTYRVNSVNRRILKSSKLINDLSNTINKTDYYNSSILDNNKSIKFVDYYKQMIIKNILNENDNNNNLEKYIVIEQDGSYSDKDWKILGIFSKRKKAILFGFNYLIDIALKPYSIEFYKKRKGEFSNYIGLPYIHIECWNEDSNKNENIYLGFQNKPYIYYIDKMLKDEEVNKRSCQDLLLEWKKIINNGEIPQELESTIISKIIKDI